MPACHAHEKISALARGLLLDRKLVVLPGLEAAFHLHDLEPVAGETRRGLRGEVTGLGVTVENVHRVLAQTTFGFPLGPGQIQRPGNVAFLEVFRLANVDDVDVLTFVNQVADLHRAGGEGYFLREEFFRLGRRNRRRSTAV